MRGEKTSEKLLIRKLTKKEHDELEKENTKSILFKIQYGNDYKEVRFSLWKLFSLSSTINSITNSFTTNSKSFITNSFINNNLITNSIITHSTIINSSIAKWPSSKLPLKMKQTSTSSPTTVIFETKTVGSFVSKKCITKVVCKFTCYGCDTQYIGEKNDKLEYELLIIDKDRGIVL